MLDTVTLDGPANVLAILGLTLPSITDEQVAAIEAAAPPGSTVTVANGLREAVEMAPGTDVIFGLITPKLFAAAPELKWVHLIASGVDTFLFPDFVESDIVLTGEKGLVGGHLADTGFGLLLALTRQIKQAIQLGPDAWQHREEMRMKELELEGLTMGVFGFGGTGRALARRAVAFGMDVIAVDEFPGGSGDGVDEVWGTDRFDDLLARSDVVAVGAPLTESTRAIFDAKAFATMRPGSFLVNVTRGELIDGDALVEALRSGHLGGAALDVAPGEPLPPDHPLFTLDNVAMTPHTAGASQLRAPRNIARFCDNLGRAQRGEPLDGAIDKRSGF